MTLDLPPAEIPTRIQKFHDSVILDDPDRTGIEPLALTKLRSFFRAVGELLPQLASIGEASAHE